MKDYFAKKTTEHGTRTRADKSGVDFRNSVVNFYERQLVLVTFLLHKQSPAHQSFLSLIIVLVRKGLILPKAFLEQLRECTQGAQQDVLHQII